MTLGKFMVESEEVRGLGEDALLVRYQGVWYLVDLERKLVLKMTSDEDLRILLGGDR